MERETVDRLEREEKGITEVESRKERDNRTKEREEMTMDEDENCLSLQLILPQNTFQLFGVSERVKEKEEEMKRIKEERERVRRTKICASYICYKMIFLADLINEVFITELCYSTSSFTLSLWLLIHFHLSSSLLLSISILQII